MSWKLSPNSSHGRTPNSRVTLIQLLNLSDLRRRRIAATSSGSEGIH